MEAENSDLAIASVWKLTVTSHKPFNKFFIPPWTASDITSRNLIAFQTFSTANGS
jgi:hypothetical protein